jgi:NAD(P)-dependent dehydrogenase (short-subunit alcohol dehydrogenase family)
MPANVLDEGQLRDVRDTVLGRWGSVDILVNAAGGNVPGATLSGDAAIFELSREAFGEVFDLNLAGTLLPHPSLRRGDGPGGGGCIVNVSSMAAARAITRAAGYSAAKAAVENLTRWLAVDFAQRYGDAMRVNAIAPGFFIGEQNRTMLTEEDGSLTERGRTIVQHTPAGRFGEPEELVGTIVWLCSPAAGFVNGVVVPVDGGFGAFSGV